VTPGIKEDAGQKILGVRVLKPLMFRKRNPKGGRGYPREKWTGKGIPGPKRKNRGKGFTLAFITKGIYTSFRAPPHKGNGNNPNFQENRLFKEPTKRKREINKFC